MNFLKLKKKLLYTCLTLELWRNMFYIMCYDCRSRIKPFFKGGSNFKFANWKKRFKVFSPILYLCIICPEILRQYFSSVTLSKYVVITKTIFLSSQTTPLKVFRLFSNQEESKLKENGEWILFLINWFYLFQTRRVFGCTKCIFPKV